MTDKILCQARAMKLQLDLSQSDKDLTTQIISQIRKHAVRKYGEPPSLPTTHRRKNGAYDGETQYYYFLQLIKDALKQVRNGRTAYVFDLWQVREIIHYEPKAQFTYLAKSESFAVTL